MITIPINQLIDEANGVNPAYVTPDLELSVRGKFAILRWRDCRGLRVSTSMEVDLDQLMAALNRLKVTKNDSMTVSKALDILAQLKAGEWRWMGSVKRFKPENFASDELRLQALSQHHQEETQHLLSTIRGLCELIEASQ